MIEEKYREQLELVSRRLREEREKVHISQIDLSFAAGVSQNQVNCIETGRTIPNLYTLLKICDALHLAPQKLFEEANTKREKDAEEIINLIRKLI